MRIKVDEDLPASATTLLREHDYQATSVLEQGMGGWKDPVLWQMVQEHEQFLVTADKGFGDIRTYPPGNHYGILLLRPDEDGVRPILALLKSVLEQYSLDALTGILTVASPRGIRIRRS